MIQREEWVPVRYVRDPHRCDFCRVVIPKASPGSVKGDRGTKAWWSKTRNVWECLTCRSEGFRAESAREAMDS